MSQFFIVTLFIVLAAISPGPDFAIVVKNSLLYNRKSGFFTSIGVSLSLLIHATYCILGLAVIISKSLLLFSVIKYIGAGYLIYIGIKSVTAKKELTTFESQNNKNYLSEWQSFRQGFLCNLLNPKAIIFLLAFFTMVVKPGSSVFTELSYGLEISIIHLIWFSFLAYMLTHQYVKSTLNKVQFYIVKVMGALLVAFGVRIATLHQVVA